MYFQHGEIRGHRLKSDIGMPTDTRKATGVAELVSQSTAFLLLRTADDADLITKFASFFGKGMNM